MDDGRPATPGSGLQPPQRPARMSPL